MDAHISSLDTDYLWFFLERVKLEEQYADNLEKLTMRTKALDSGTDQLGFDNAKHALPTIRSAWRQLRENSEQEIEAKRLFAQNIRLEVIKPLTTMKATQSRISSRIAEDVKNAREKYNEKYSELQKLQKVYIKRSTEYHDLSTRDGAYPSPTQPPPSTFPSPTLRSHAVSHSHSNSLTSSAASLLTAVDRSSITTQNLALEAKKGFNQLFSGLRGSSGGNDEGGKEGGMWGVKMGMDENREREKVFSDKEKEKDQDRLDREKERERGRNEADTIRTVKTKRDAEEADQKYRREIFNLESLRINMERIAQGGSNSTAEFVQDLILTLQRVFSKYTSGIQATSNFSVQLARMSEESVEAVSLPRDLQSGLAALGGVRDLPLPILYQNFYHGPCRDLIFDVSLQDYAFSRGISEDPNRIPIIVEKCISGIEERGLETEGLYRISPRLSTVQTLVHKIEIDEEAFQFPRTEEISTIAAILKLYLRRLPEPPFRLSLQERLAFTKEREDHIANDFIVLKTKLKRMPAIHIATLRAVIFHLCRVVVADNKMDAKNLSIIFSSILFGEEGQGLPGRDSAKEVDLLTLMQASKDTFFEDLLMYATVIFESPNISRPTSAYPSHRPSPLPSPQTPPVGSFGPPQQGVLGRSNTSASKVPTRFALPGRSRSGSINSPFSYANSWKPFKSGSSTPEPKKGSPTSPFSSQRQPDPTSFFPNSPNTTQSVGPLSPIITDQGATPRGLNLVLSPTLPSGPNHLEIPSTSSLASRSSSTDSTLLSPGLANLAALSQAALEREAGTVDDGDQPAQYPQ